MDADKVGAEFLPSGLGVPPLDFDRPGYLRGQDIPERVKIAAEVTRQIKLRGQGIIDRVQIGKLFAVKDAAFHRFGTGWKVS